MTLLFSMMKSRKNNEKSRKKIKIKGKTQMIGIRLNRSDIGKQWLDETKEAEILEQGIGWSKVKQGNRVLCRIEDERFERDTEGEKSQRLMQDAGFVTTDSTSLEPKELILLEHLPVYIQAVDLCQVEESLPFSSI